MRAPEPFGGVWPFELTHLMVERIAARGGDVPCPGWSWDGKPLDHPGQGVADRLLVATCGGICGGWVAPACHGCCDAVLAKTSPLPVGRALRRAKWVRRWRMVTLDPEPHRIPWQVLRCPLCPQVLPGQLGFIFREQLRVEGLPTRVARS